MPLDISLLIAEIDINTTHSYDDIVRWNLIDHSLPLGISFKRKVASNLARLDMETGYPRFLLQTIIDGDVDAVDSTSQAWNSLNQSLKPVAGQLSCSEPGITPTEKQIALCGYDHAYAAAVLETTERRGTHNDNISLNFPRFKNKAQENIYLDCLRRNMSSGDGRLRGWRIVDALCMLCDRMKTADGDTDKDQNRLVLLDKLVNQFLSSLRAGPVKNTPKARRMRRARIAR